MRLIMPIKPHSTIKKDKEGPIYTSNDPMMPKPLVQEATEAAPNRKKGLKTPPEEKKAYIQKI